MRQLKYFFSNLWDLITLGRFKTPKEKLFEVAKKQGYSTIYKIPKKYKGQKKYTKAPKIRS